LVYPCAASFAGCAALFAVCAASLPPCAASFAACAASVAAGAQRLKPLHLCLRIFDGMNTFYLLFLNSKKYG